MPDHPSSEDPFADLFGKLPDPRTRDARRSGSTPDTPERAEAGGPGPASAGPSRSDAVSPPPSKLKPGPPDQRRQ